MPFNFVFNIILGIILFVIYIRFLENTFIFYPSRSMEITPHMIGLSYEDIFYKTQDNLLINGWLVKAPDAKFTVIFSHGNAGNISSRMEKIQLMHRVGVNVFIFDYRGYGRSQGRPSEKGIYLDAQAAYDYLIKRPDIDPEKIITFGESLGGAAAVDLATQRKVAGLIVDSSFTKAADMSRKVFPFLPTFLLKTKMDSVTKIVKVSVPKLFLHSPDDEVVPYRLGRKLFEVAKEPKMFVNISGGHNDGFLLSEGVYVNALIEFFNKLVLRK
jgi:uncharacterized protein